MDSGSVVFDRYRLEERIGKGATGVVWRAADLLLDQTVALKRVFLGGVDDEQAELIRQRALREARLAAQLRHHRHVVATYACASTTATCGWSWSTSLPEAWPA